MSDLHERAFDYLWNVDPRIGSSFIGRFDDDHAPIGPSLRADLVSRGWAWQAGGKITAERPPRKFWSDRGDHSARDAP